MNLHEFEQQQVDNGPKYGVDRYSRYVVQDGQRLAVEPYPFFYWSHPVSSLISKVSARLSIVQWHINIIHQGGYRKMEAICAQEIADYHAFIEAPAARPGDDWAQIEAQVDEFERQGGWSQMDDQFDDDETTASDNQNS
jgi:hypothetical protein